MKNGKVSEPTVAPPQSPQVQEPPVDERQEQFQIAMGAMEQQRNAAQNHIVNLNVEMFVMKKNLDKQEKEITELKARVAELEDLKQGDIPNPKDRAALVDNPTPPA